MSAALGHAGDPGDAGDALDAGDARNADALGDVGGGGSDRDVVRPGARPSAQDSAGSPVSDEGAVRCSWAVLRVVPHPHLAHGGAAVPVGVLLHARTEEFLGLRARTDRGWLETRVPDADVPLLVRYLESVRAIVRGDEAAGPVALHPPSERFHWLTAPRSDVIQPSPVRHTVCTDPAAELERLFRETVGPPADT